LECKVGSSEQFSTEGTLLEKQISKIGVVMSKSRVRANSEDARSGNPRKEEAPLRMIC